LRTHGQAGRLEKVPSCWLLRRHALQIDPARSVVSTKGNTIEQNQSLRQPCVGDGTVVMSIGSGRRRCVTVEE
jgi:hypothetical protein